MFVPQRIPLSCPLVGCNGIGHVNGIDLSHVTLCGCPLYHNVKFEKWAEMRAREEGLVSPVQLFSRTTSPVNSPAKLSKMHPAERAHQFWTSKTEPSLEGLASQIEIYKFRCAQQRLLFDKVSIYLPKRRNFHEFTVFLKNGRFYFLYSSIFYRRFLFIVCRHSKIFDVLAKVIWTVFSFDYSLITWSVLQSHQMKSNHGSNPKGAYSAFK